MKKISVITVSYNAAERIERTIKSIVRQDCRDFEYILVDGASTDGTQEIVQRYSNQITKWISEPDTGIYSAMNKGVQMASGEYCIFMNAGDMFCNSTVLSRVIPHLDGKASIVMGNQIFLDKNGSFAFYGKTWPYVTRERLFSDSLYHQASFISREDLLNHPYDETLKMVSDWKEAIVLLLVQHKAYSSMNLDVSFFYQDGVTYSQTEVKNSENRFVQKEFFSQEERVLFSSRRKEYKRTSNVSRYVNWIKRLFFQLYKKVTVDSVQSWR